MPQFKYRLEPILKLRKTRQEQQERKLAQRTGQFLRVRGQLETIEGQIDQHYDAIRRGAVGALDVEELIGDRRYLNHLHQLRQAESNALAAAARLVDQAKKELVEAKKQTDIMAKLKENARQRFGEEQRRKETVALDDMATSKFAWARQMESGGQSV